MALPPDEPFSVRTSLLTRDWPRDLGPQGLAIGQQITRAEEVVSARPALAAEAAKLRVRPGSLVLTIARTYYTDERPVETADIVIPVERYSLVYEVPVR